VASSRTGAVAKGASTQAKRGIVGRVLGRRSREASPIRGEELRTAALFVLPAFLLYFVFMLYPFLNSIYFSLTSWNGATATKEFVGLSNYLAMLQDSALWEALWRNAVWIIIGTIAPVAIGLLLALILWSSKPRLGLAFRTFFFLPYILPVVVVGLVWGWIYHPIFGVINTLLELIGLDSLTRGWLGDPGTALLSVLGAGIWGVYGFATALLFAGLQGVNTDVVEAAEIDGANWFQRARYVVIPTIAPVLTLVTAIILIGGFAVIDFIVIMTNGGPGTSTEVLGFYAYKNGFQENQVGYGAAVSMLITAMSLVAAIAFVRFRERGSRD
jgi:raffinose/stachyose/melibiose transport system permease protein